MLLSSSSGDKIPLLLFTGFVYSKNIHPSVSYHTVLVITQGHDPAHEDEEYFR